MSDLLVESIVKSIFSKLAEVQLIWTENTLADLGRGSLTEFEVLKLIEEEVNEELKRRIKIQLFVGSDQHIYVHRVTD